MKKMLLFGASLAVSAVMMATNVTEDAVLSHMRLENPLSKVKTASVDNAVRSDVLMKGFQSSYTKDATTVDVLYRRPVGTFFYAYLVGTGTYNGLLVGPAYEYITWVNQTTGATDITKSSWKGASTSTADPEIAQDYEIVYPAVTAPRYGYKVPMLTVDSKSFVMSYTSGTASKEYSYQAGWGANDGTYNFGLSSMDITNDNFTGMFRARIASTTDAADQAWTQVTEKPNGKVMGFAQKFEKPASPYVLHGIRWSTYLNAKTGAEYTLTIRKITDDGKIGDVLATSTLTLEKDINASDNGTTSETQHDIYFAVKGVDPVTGFETDNLIVNSAVFVEVTGVRDAKTTNFQPMLGAMELNYAKRIKEYAAYVRIEDGEDVGYYNMANWSYNLGDNNDTPSLTTSYLVALDAEFPFICAISEDNGLDKEIIYNATGAAETKEYYLDASVKADNLNYDGVGEEIPDWVNVTASDETVQGKSYIKLSFQLSALPATVTGRTAKIKVSSNGADKYFTINQGSGSVAGVEVSPVTVSTVGGNFEVSYPAGITSVSVYNVSGQLMQTVALEGGKTTISGSDMAKGLYILKFNDNTTVKAIK